MNSFVGWILHAFDQNGEMHSMFFFPLWGDYLSCQICCLYSSFQPEVSICDSWILSVRIVQPTINVYSHIHIYVYIYIHRGIYIYRHTQTHVGQPPIMSLLFISGIVSYMLYFYVSSWLRTLGMWPVELWTPTCSRWALMPCIVFFFRYKYLL